MHAYPVMAYMPTYTSQNCCYLASRRESHLKARGEDARQTGATGT